MHTIQSLSLQPWVDRLGWTLLHFLWQGTLIAAVYAAARRLRTPQIRYALSCVALASMVLAAFATFAVLGNLDGAPELAFTAPVPLSSGTANAVPLSLPAITTAVWSDNIIPWLVMAWFAGAMVFCVRLAGGWIVAARMQSTLVRPAPAHWQRTLDEISARILISRPVRLLVSALVQVPTVVGWFRPVVLVPIGALAGLPPEHVEALLAHELAHIRRHDYLVNVLQSIAEAMLFYHPAVWWISNHIRNERELCCDDVAVAVTGDAFIDARALADLELHRPAHFLPALAATGGELASRIARLLGVHRSDTRRASGPALVAVGTMILITAAATFAQQAAPKPTFEVASIKPSPPENVGVQSYVKGDRYTAMTATLRDLISFAYRLRSFQISGGPAWASSAAYNISAKMDPGAKPDESLLMMQSLLADRFKLKFHRITKDRAGYALVVDKSGPKLTESKNPGPGLGHGRGNLYGRGADMATLVKSLAEQLDSPVANRTGLKALYDFTLTWTPDEEAAASMGPSLFTSLQEQLGLRLEPVKNVPVDILVIDSAERPSEN